MYQKILLASDGSDHSLRAADHAIHLAKGTPNTFVEVVYVIDSSKSKSEVLENWNSMGVTEVRREKIKETEKKAQEADIDYKLTFLRGEPGPTIVEYANENQFDIVVVGSRGLNALQEMVLGSVSHKIAKRVNCPVLIVK